MAVAAAEAAVAFAPTPEGKAAAEGRVRQTPSWPSAEAGATSAFYPCFYCYIRTGMHEPTCIFWANLTSFSLKLAEAAASLFRELEVDLGINPIITVEK